MSEEQDDEHDFDQHETPSPVATVKDSTEKIFASYSHSFITQSLEHEKHIHDDTVPEYDDETKRLIQTADHARNEYHDVERRVHDVKREIE